MSVVFINVSDLHPHPRNPRLSVNEEVVEQIAAQIGGGMDEAHALIVRPNAAGYEILSGHHRVIAAQKAGLDTVPCWVREMSDLKPLDPFSEISDALILANGACNVHSFTLREAVTTTSVAVAFDGETFTAERVDVIDGKIDWLKGWLKISMLADALYFWNVPVCPDSFEWELSSGANFFQANGGASLYPQKPVSNTNGILSDGLEDVEFSEYIGRDSIYFIKAKGLGLIKIGFSSNAPKRFATLRTSSPDDLEVLNIIPGGQQIERALHQRFAAQRVRGEWFNPSPDILDFIKEGKTNG